ncbi:MAG: cyclic nucleotide-binding and patatin-like phospholipase domain-containing protein [Lysobacterales bacterium]
MTETQAQVRQLAEKYFEIPLPEESLNAFEICEIAGGDWLFRQGDDGNSLYLLVRGRLQVFKENPEPQPPHLLGEVVPGESVGEVGLLSGESRSAGIRAIRDSLLIKMSRKSFEKLSASHPALIMKLASHVAKLLQRSNSGAGAAAAKRLSSITLLPLTDSTRAREFCRELTKGLEGFGPTLSLSCDNLVDIGAPVNLSTGQDDIPDALKFWVHDQETRNRFLIYRCEANDSPWTRFAMRQSDLVVFFADAKDHPGLSDWEARLRAGKGAATGRQALVLLQPGSDTPITATARWLKERRPHFHLHVRKDKADDIQRVARVISGNALGLVLGGGGARGYAHLGVYKALLELGIVVDWVGGASIGSIFAGPVAADWSYDKAYQVARHSFVKGKPFSDYTLPVAALIRGRRMERELNATQDLQIEDMPLPFFCISSILDSGELCLHESGHLASALRAGAALPGVIPPAVVNKRLHIDGAVLNSLPVDLMLQKPVGRVIAVDLSSHKSYEVDYPAIPSPWAILAGRFLPFMRKYRVPSLATTILKATEIGTQHQVRLSGKMADLLLRPPVRQFGLTNVSAFEQIVETGYHYAKPELVKWLDMAKTDDLGS